LAKIIGLIGLVIMSERLLMAVWNRNTMRGDPWGTPFSSVKVLDM